MIIHDWEFFERLQIKNVCSEVCIEEITVLELCEWNL